MDGLELYLHIPFCMKKCDYCDFLSFPADRHSKQKYVEALQREIAFYGTYFKDVPVETIFVGGGTPSFLDTAQMLSLMETVRDFFPVREDAEITVECNPGTVTAEKLDAYKKIGINRLSIGLQSPDNRELVMLGRVHTWEQFLKTYELARKQEFDNINVDLMTSLPGQTYKSFLKSLETVLLLKPEHLSAYSLMIEKGTPFYNRYKFDAVKQEAGMQTEILPDEETMYQITKKTQQLLQERGYHWYETSNFAKPGKECRHNIGYWTRKDYLGLGLGASSLLDNVRTANVTDLYTYIEDSNDIHLLESESFATNLHASSDAVSRKAQMEEFMFLGLRLIDGIKRETFFQTFGVQIEAIYGDTMGMLIDRDLLEQKEGVIRLTDLGQDVSNRVLAQFLLD